MSQALMVAFYARVSSNQQAKRGTIESQIAALAERIVADGVHVAEDMRFVDAGVSGATLIRPQLERLRDRAALGLVDRLYVLSPDRLSRKYAHQALLMEELSACGVQVVFLNHAIGVTPEESLLLQMQGMIAEYKRAKIMERRSAIVAESFMAPDAAASMYCRPRRTVIATFASNLMAHPHSTLSTWRKRQRSEPSFNGLVWSD